MISCHFAVSENLHTPLTEGDWKFLGEEGVSKFMRLRKCMKLNWNLKKGVEGLLKVPSIYHKSSIKPLAGLIYFKPI